MALSSAPRVRFVALRRQNALVHFPYARPIFGDEAFPEELGAGLDVVRHARDAAEFSGPFELTAVRIEAPAAQLGEALSLLQQPERATREGDSPKARTPHHHVASTG